MTPTLPIIDGCIFIDNSTIEMITTCPRSAEYYWLHQRELTGDYPALRFGENIHAALAHRYKCEGENKPWSLGEQIEILVDLFEDNPCETEEWRNLNMACSVIQAYNEKYIAEPFNVVKHENSPFVEHSFASKIGQVKGLTVIYTGRIDLYVEAPGEGFFVMDHKTTSVLGDYYWYDMAMTAQLRGYCWAVRECTGIEPTGYVINALGCRKPTKTGTAIEFARQRFFTKVPEGQLDEWRLNLLAQVEAFINYSEKAYYPMHTKWCVRKYGLCPYYHVCELPSKSRLAALSSGAYKDVTWSPLKQ